MTVYTAPIRDISFLLEELIGLGDIAALPGFDDITPETVAAILDQAGRFGEQVLAPTNAVGDQTGCRLENGAVTTPAPFADAYRRFCADGWHGMAHDPSQGGQGMPRLIATAVSEIWHGANVALALCPTLTDGAAVAFAAHGDTALKDGYLRQMISGETSCAMVMTEPQAGSDIGALTCRAVPDGDGYRLFGQKIFISWGEHDLTDNIVHLVLARLPDAPPGSRGISLFLAPKYLPGADGALGARNDMRCLRLEGKLGLHGSPTCVMEYGAGEGARGWIVGDPHKGLAAMFTMMNTARLAIGHQGIGIAERAWQQARAYANDRRQGRAPGTADTPAPIIAHGDVRRMLIGMKARIEAMRALALLAARSVDLATHHPDSAVRDAHAARVGLLTPIVKAWCTDGAVEIASEAIQIHGGAGYIEETGAAQHLRDARITPIYEGTNGIQALDLVGRKLGADDGATAFALIAELREAAAMSPATLDALDLLENTMRTLITT
ncbi:MAG: acyl-CoA dehydrogenase family protein, partial [Alphaproteobacteria bacterium]